MESVVVGGAAAHLNSAWSHHCSLLGGRDEEANGHVLKEILWRDGGRKCTKGSGRERENDKGVY